MNRLKLDDLVDQLTRESSQIPFWLYGRPTPYLLRVMI